MKKYLFNILIAGAALFTVVGCDTKPEAFNLQPPFEYTEAYYANLRAYKQTDHAICFVWFADYSQSNSMGYRFAGLPDSVDICSLWGGIPTPEKNPLAYNEMWEMRNKKGTRIISVHIVQIGMYKDQLGVTDEEIKAPYEDGETPEWIKKFGDMLLDEMWEHNLDGLDLDYEPGSDLLQGRNFTTFVKYLGQFVGPKGADPTKLLCIDFFSHYPPAETEPYASYFVRQAYTQGFTEHSATILQSYLEEWIPTKKFIVTENIGDHYRTGGSPFTEADGNKYLPNGERLHSLQGMARWNPIQGRKGGFGAFYVQRDYNTTTGGATAKIPYYNVRSGIQWQNPAITK